MSNEQSPQKRMKIKDESQIEGLKKTLKDLDFDKLENKIWLGVEDCERVRRTLKEDSRFFAENGLIDYSLIVIKVDYRRYSRHQRRRKSPQYSEDSTLLNRRTMFHSAK